MVYVVIVCVVSFVAVVFSLISRHSVKLIFSFAVSSLVLCLVVLYVSNLFMASLYPGLNTDRSGAYSGMVAQIFCGKYEVTEIVCLTGKQVSGYKVQAFISVSRGYLSEELAASIRYVMPIVDAAIVDLEICLLEDGVVTGVMSSEYFDRCVELRKFRIVGR